MKKKTKSKIRKKAKSIPLSKNKAWLAIKALIVNTGHRTNAAELVRRDR